MSVPLSLRLCCVAAMAPALTETTGQSRLQLPGSPPPVVSASDNLSGDYTETILASEAIKAKVTLSSDKTRGLLTPIHRNSYQHKFLTEKVKKSLRDLGLPANFPIDTAKQPPVDNGSESRSSEQLSNHKDAYQKMNQASNGNRPNGTERQFLIQNSVAEEKTLNGHSNNHKTNKLKYNIILKDKLPDVRGLGICNVQNVTSKQNINMCQTTESGSGRLAPSSSGNGHNGTRKYIKLSIPQSHVAQTPTVSSVQESIINPAELSNDALKKQHTLERRSQFLLRRIRRLQGRQLDSRVKTQLKAFIDFQHQHLQTVASKAIRPFSENAFFNCSDVKNLSTSNLVTLVRKLQASQPKPLLDANVRNNKKGVLHMDQVVSSETERRSGLLRTNVRHWNDVVDSDKTESSSGGESCEEWEDCPVMSDKKVPTPL